MDPYSAAAIAIGSIISSYFQSGATGDAVQAEIAAANQALDLQRQIYNTQMAQQAPWIGVGQASVMRLGQLMGIYGDTVKAGGIEPIPKLERPLNTSSGPTVTVDGNPRPDVPTSHTMGQPGTSGTQPVGPGVTLPPSGRTVMPTSLANVGVGASGPVSVTDPNGGVHNFNSNVQAYAFAKQAGIA